MKDNKPKKGKVRKAIKAVKDVVKKPTSNKIRKTKKYA